MDGHANLAADPAPEPQPAAEPQRPFTRNDVRVHVLAHTTVSPAEIGQLLDELDEPVGREIVATVNPREIRAILARVRESVRQRQLAYLRR